MRQRISIGTTADKRLLNIKEACIYVGLGQTRTRQYMDQIGATRYFGRRVLYDKTIIDAALNEKEA